MYSLLLGPLRGLLRGSIQRLEPQDFGAVIVAGPERHRIG
jgi:hypothetical protein